MSQTNLGKAVRCFMAVLLVAHSFALLACSGGEPQFRSLNNTPATCTGPSATNSTGSIGAVIGQGLTFSPANVFDSHFPASVALATLTFTSVTAFSLSSTNGGPAAGTIGAFSSTGGFTMAYATSSYTATGATQGPLALQTNAFTACSIQVTAGGVEIGGDRVNAAVTVTLTSTRGTVVSQAFTLQMRIAPDGTLILVNPITGAEILTNVNVQIAGTVGVS